jgi:hypothetical protein
MSLGRLARTSRAGLRPRPKSRLKCKKVPGDHLHPNLQPTLAASLREAVNGCREAQDHHLPAKAAEAKIFRVREAVILWQAPNMQNKPPFLLI